MQLSLIIDNTYSLCLYNVPQNLIFSLEKNNFLSYLPTPPLGQDMTQGQFLSGV